ncbi:hypothetical protein ABZP36_022570 [Zizania latifolia]
MFPDTTRVCFLQNPNRVPPPPLARRRCEVASLRGMNGGNGYHGSLADMERGGAGAGEAAAAVGRFFFLRSLALRVAVVFLLWGASGIILGTVPDLSISIGHMLLCFSLLLAGVTLLIVAVVTAPGCPASERAAAAALEGWLAAMI